MLRRILDRKWFLLAQLLGWPALILAVWTWLGIPERGAGDLLLSLLLALAILAGAAALLAWAMAARFLRVLGYVVVVALIAAAAIVIAGYDASFGGWAAAKLSVMRKKPVNPLSIASGFAAVVKWAAILMSFIALPALIGSRRLLRRWQYWAGCVVLLLIGVWLPLTLMQWAPAMGGIPAQTASMIVRFGVAYVVMLAMLLLFGAMVARFTRQP